MGGDHFDPKRRFVDKDPADPVDKPDRFDGPAFFDLIEKQIKLVLGHALEAFVFESLDRLVGIAFRTIRIEEDHNRPSGQAYSPDDRDHAERARSAAFNQLVETGMDRVGAVLRTGELQMRPVLMTCVIAGVGLLPAALSSGIGSQVQKPLAIVVVGGMMLAPVVILVTLPVLILLFSRRAARPVAQGALAAPAE